MSAQTMAARRRSIGSTQAIRRASVRAIGCRFLPAYLAEDLPGRNRHASKPASSLYNVAATAFDRPLYTQELFKC
jgi:hypothetical protein